MRIFAIAFILCTILFSCEEKPVKQTVTPVAKIDSEVHWVSLINLLSTPEKYHNKFVGVTGFMNLQFEGNSLFFHKEDYENYIIENSLWLDISLLDSIAVDSSIDEKPKITLVPVKTFNKGYVHIIGTFDTSDHGHMGLRSGSINNISYIRKIWKKHT